jgi:hypothetical protein
MIFFYIYIKIKNINMKYLKEFDKFNESISTDKLNETGEWPRDIDWDYVKDNPDDVDEYTSRIKGMADAMENLKDYLPDGFPFELKDVVGFDNYQGAYAIVVINGSTYSVWEASEEGFGDIFWIDGYKMDNTSGEGKKAGFQGTIDEIAEALIATESY